MINNKISPKKMELSHLVSTRPTSHILEKRDFSPDGKFRTKIFQSRSISMNKMEKKRNPEMIE
jgi:hypothetical protein